jgi:DNA-binding LacI/PurR family transcriptional regulator
MIAGSRHPTIIDVAERAGVSKSVVSRVFSGRGSVRDTTRRRVLGAASELGYVVNASARAMTACRTYTLGVFIRDAATPFYGHLLTAMQERAARHGYRTVTATGAGTFEVAEERRALETLVMLQVEGLLVCSGALPSDDVEAIARRVPTVVVGRPETSPMVTSVFCDEVHGGRALADHLADLGHRNVAVFTLAPEQSLTMAPRTAAMAGRLAERGVRVVELPAGPLERVGELIGPLLGRPELTAVMAPSDAYALRALEGLAQAGVAVPGRVSVTGYDGIGVFTTPLIGLTTWRQPLDEIGRRGVDALVELLDADAPPARHQGLHGTLVRGRTAAAPSR